MLDMDEIEAQIAHREMGDTSWANCQALAILYSVRDHFKGHLTIDQTKSVSNETTGDLGQSEFLQAASGVDIEKLMGLIDEHMEAVKVVFPSEYKMVINRLISLKSE